MKKPTTQNYIILPPRGISAGQVVPSTLGTSNFLLSLETVRVAATQGPALATAKIKTKMKVLASVHENGAKLVEMSPEDVSNLRAEQPGLRVVPEVFYQTARAPRPELAAAPKAAGAAAAVKISISVVSSADGKPIAKANVVAFTDFKAKAGARGKTNSKGVVSLALGGANKKIERLYIYSESGFWGVLKTNVTLKAGTKIEMQPIDLSFTDCLRHFYSNSPLTAGATVKVGIIDTGVGPHQDLVVEGGENTVVGEDPRDYGDSGAGHGTHVAGIVAARGTPSSGVRGIAPGVTLRSYRVFGKNSEGASNFSIAKAIDRAVSDGCDLINMSLGGGAQDEATHSAMADARAKGTLVIVATGNDGRLPVSFPAADSLALAVTALGRADTFPPGTVEFGDVTAPFGTDKKNFIALFSNVGSEVDLTGPGLGIISTYPGNRYAVMDGTSMACPAATGAAAKLLAGNPVMSQPRDQARSDAMAKIILTAAKSLGFPATLEGQGLI